MRRQSITYASQVGGCLTLLGCLIFYPWFTGFSQSGHQFLFDKMRMQFVLRSELPLFERIRFNLLHPQDSSGDRPRATWAQIIQAWHISDASCLVKARLNADSIPAMIDVPMQRIRLTDLGHLALALGCSEVELDTKSRHFKANGPHCILTSETVPTFGQAVRFEGDISTLMNNTFGNYDRMCWHAAIELTYGRFLHFEVLEGSSMSSSACPQSDYEEHLGNGAGELAQLMVDFWTMGRDLHDEVKGNPRKGGMPGSAKVKNSAKVFC